MYYYKKVGTMFSYPKVKESVFTVPGLLEEVNVFKGNFV